MDVRFAPSLAETRRVKSIQFGILSPDEIRQMSAVEITNTMTFDPKTKKPVQGGLSDARLGVPEKGMDCETCKGDYKECPGHFGHFELAAPVFHVGFLRTVLNVLRCVCINCSRLLADEENPQFAQALKVKNGKNRLKKMLDVCGKKKRCEGGDVIDADQSEAKDDEVTKGHGGCGSYVPTFTVDGLKVMIHYKLPKKADDEAQANLSEKKQELSAERVLSILKGITDEQCQMLGFNPKYARPDWMILQAFPVPPPPVRPSIKPDPTSRSEDDLTYMLSAIIRASDNLKSKEKAGVAPHVLIELTKVLQWNVATYFNNELPGLPRNNQKSGRPMKAISSRLKAKEGRVRGNLMGKRVDFSARTVITADPNLNIDELGVPWSIAQNMTFPEVVTPYNIDRLTEYVDTGGNPPPGKVGAKCIIRDDGRRTELMFSKKTFDLHLEYGYKVERNLIDGDYVLFNRQPSLHKMSIMGHRIKVMPYSTFRLNLSVTSPYNADFDGDEMNMHVPQSYESRAEVIELMLVPKCVVSPQSNRPVMGIVQDTLLGCRKITKRDTFIEKDVFMNILLWWEDFDGKVPSPTILKPKPLWTGKQVFNLIIPKQINLIRYSSWHPDDETGFLTPGDTCVRIEKGEVLSGTLCKKTLGASSGSLIHVIWEEVGPDAARKFLGHTQWLINYWLLQHSFTMGIGDTIADAATIETINQVISRAKGEVRHLIVSARENRLDAEPGQTVIDTLEKKVNQVLNMARDDAGKCAQRSLTESNNLKAMVTAGSKGSHINISQMSACVGQQNVEGKRIPFGFNGRTLPHFTKDDNNPESRGFVENSYLRGLTPPEFFFHAMGGREGLIDTAVKTAETGYIQRRLVKAMEDIMVKYDGTVRNSLGDVIQFLYGEDGLDAVWIESQKLDILSGGKKKFENVYEYEVDQENWNPSYLLPEHVEELQTIPDCRAALRAEVEKLVLDKRMLATEIAPTGENTYPLPVNLKRIIWNAQKLFKVDPRKASDMHPLEIMQALDRLQEKLVVVPGNDRLSIEAQKNATLFFNILLRSTLASKRVLQEYHLTRDAFEWVLGEIECRFLQSLVAPGEMIGCVAAQSIGEPATQMTLNTFHFAGVSAKNVTLGVPRLKEIINVAKNIKTPSLSVFLNSEFNKDKDKAKTVRNSLEYTTMQSVTEAAEIWYDPDPTNTLVEEDAEWMALHFVNESLSTDFSPWVLRLQFGTDLMCDKNVTMEDVKEVIENEFGDDMKCIISDENNPNRVLRLYIVNEGNSNLLPEGKNEEDDCFLKCIETEILNNVALSGIPDINKVYIKSHKSSKFDEIKGFVPEEEWALDTEGVNLLAVMIHENVDDTRTLSNQMVEVLEVLGIEAARKALLDELRAVISFDGSYVNYRHLAILCDTMTYRGHLMAITRHGINRNETGPLMRCSFEETVDILLDAAGYAENDSLRGVTENIMLGQLAPIGTGSFSLLLNKSMLQDAVELPPPSLHTKEDDYLGSVYNSPVASPYQDLMSPNRWDSPTTGAQFSPFIGSMDAASPSYSPNQSPYSPNYDPFSPLNSPSSLTYSPSSPTYSPSSPAYSPSSPAYSPVSPSYSPLSPSYSPTSPAYDAVSPTYSPTSPAYNPLSPSYSPTSPSYSPTSPSYSPTSPSYSPTSPQYNPSSPAYSPTSPSYSPTSPQYSPSSPAYSPTSPRYNPSSPAYSPSSSLYSPSSSPVYSPLGSGTGAASPIYTSSSTPYSPTSPSFNPASARYSPSSPPYSPTSPNYTPKDVSSYGPPVAGGEYSPSDSPYGPISPSFSPDSPTRSSDNPDEPEDSDSDKSGSDMESN